MKNLILVFIGGCVNKTTNHNNNIVAGYYAGIECDFGDFGGGLMITTINNNNNTKHEIQNTK